MKILVCCHKQDLCYRTASFYPIHVGKSCSVEDLGIPGDDIGDNISYKNQSYCELTGLYWAWKNLKDTDVVGLCHYRRYFDFYNQCKFGYPLTEFDKDEFDSKKKDVPDNLIKKVCDGSVILPKKNTVSPLFIQYAIHHRSEDLNKLRKVIAEGHDSKYVEAFDAFFYHNNKFSPFNMFIMRWDMFCDYCTWLFDVINRFEKVTELTSYDSYQARLYGFVAERLLNVYVNANELDVIEKPIMSFTDDKTMYGRTNNYLFYFLSCKVKDFYNFLSCHLSL